MTNEQKESLLRGLLAYKYVPSKYYYFAKLPNGKPYLWCPYKYCKRKKNLELVPYFSEVYADDSKPGTYNIAFYRCNYDKTPLLLMKRVIPEVVKAYVDDLYGSAQRCSIKEYDGRNHPTTLRKEIERIKIYEDDKFRYAEEIVYFDDVVDEVMKNEYNTTS